MDKAKLPGHGLSEMPESPRSLPNAVRVIDVLTYPAVQLLDVTGPIQVFASANDIVANAGGARPYLLRVVAQGGEGVTASAGVALAAGPLPQRDEALDTLLVAGGEGAEAAAENPVLVDWVRERATQARRTASVCTGAFLLAAAGMLDGRRAATHWKYCARLAQRFPLNGSGRCKPGLLCVVPAETALTHSRLIGENRERKIVRPKAGSSAATAIGIPTAG